MPSIFDDLNAVTRKVCAPTLARQILTKSILIKNLEREHPPIPPTWRQKFHWWFREKRIRLGEIIAGQPFNED
jgi:hypothetical protein